VSLHKSLAEKSRGFHRNVLKRFERIKFLKEKDKWDEENPKYYGLPKVKSLKVKVKKVKEEKPAEGEAAAAAQETTDAAPQTKETRGKNKS